MARSCGHGDTGDIARATRLALEVPEAAGQIFNICESRTWSFRQWSERIARAANWDGEFVTVPDDAVPADMKLTKSFGQHLLFDATKARSILSWADLDPNMRLEASVNWHLAHPPRDATDFADDDNALRAS